MTDADKLRDILEQTDCGRGQWEPLLDALVAERDEAIEKHRLLLYDFGAYVVEAKAKKSEVARINVCVAELEAALTRYRGGTPRKGPDVT